MSRVRDSQLFSISLLIPERFLQANQNIFIKIKNLSKLQRRILAFQYISRYNEPEFLFIVARSSRT